MKQLRFSTTINVPKEKVWNTMLGKETYLLWTDVFNPDGGGSSFEGSWEQGADVRFIGLDKDGTRSGMISRIKEARPYDYLSIEHLGTVENGVDHLWTEEERGPSGVFENYTFQEQNGVTTLDIAMDSKEEWAGMFEDLWPKALAKLKELAEQA